MQAGKSITILLVMGLILFPWQLVCLAHPTGHNHHDHDGPSPCELRKEYKGTDDAYFPAMHCKTVQTNVSDYQIPSGEHESTTEAYQQTKPIIGIVALYTCSFYPQPEACSNSDPPRWVIALRGPPTF